MYTGPHIITDGLVLALDTAAPRSYPGSGTTINDLSSSGLNGTLVGSPPFSTDNSGILDFDGSSDYITCGTTDAVDLIQNKTNFTLGIWFKMDALGSLRGLIGTLNYSCTKNLGLVAIDELEVLEPFNNEIHAGQDPRLQRLISYIVQHPNQTHSLPTLSRLAGASVRTIERLFKAETGMTFRQWRSRFKLMNSLALFTQGENTQGKSATAVAHELGYKSVSSFIATFKSQFGCTPQEYVARK